MESPIDHVGGRMARLGISLDSAKPATKETSGFQ